MYELQKIFGKWVFPVLRWLYFPPFISFVLCGILLLFRGGGGTDSIHGLLWCVAIAAYVTICCISAAHLMRRDTRFSLCTMLLAQGLVLSVTAVHFGSQIASFIGFAIFLIGLASAFVNCTREHSTLPPEVMVLKESSDDVSIDQIMSKLQIPLCYTDSANIVEEATSDFLEAVGKKPEELIGEVITRTLGDEKGEIMLSSGKWYLDIVKSGSRKYYHLMPTPDGKPPREEIQKKKTAPTDMAMLDGETGLYSPGYRNIRGPEEVARAQRYKRPLSAILVQLVFDMSSRASLSREQSAMLKTAFAQKVKEILRDTDCGFWMDDMEQMLLLLPETPQAGAKTLVSRLQMLPQDVFDEEIREVVHPKVIAGMYFCSGQGATIDYGVFTASLEQAFASAKEGAVAAA